MKIFPILVFIGFCLSVNSVDYTNDTNNKEGVNKKLYVEKKKNLRSLQSPAVDKYKEIKEEQKNQEEIIEKEEIIENQSDIIKGINWFGFETEYEDLMCTWSNDIDWNLQRMKEIGFNFIRLPFSLEFIKKGNWEKMDLFFEKAQQYEMNVALDFHRLHNSFQSSKPYDQDYSFDEFLYGWRTIIQRYEKYNILKAIDIFNEYQSSNYVEWNSLSRQIVSFIEESFPNRFIFFVGGVNWGGDIHYMDLEDLLYSNRIWYSVHKYWFSDQNPYEEKWNYSFGDHKPIVNVGEWGYKSNVRSEVEWANSFVDYLIEKGIRDTFFWTWSFNSGDTGGILKEDCTNVDQNKVELLKRLWNS